MELGLGWLRWTPEVFWNATLRELIATMDGLTESKGGQTPRSRAEMVKDLKQLIADTPSLPVHDDTPKGKKHHADRQ